MEDVLSFNLLGTPVIGWIKAAAYIVGAFVLGKVLYFISGKIVKRFTQKTKTTLDDVLVEKLERPVIFAVMLIGINIGIDHINLWGILASVIDKSFVFMFLIIGTWIAARVMSALFQEFILPFSEKRDNVLFDNSIVPLAQKFINYLIWGVGIILALDNIGYDVGAIIASLGIGGLALAMAAKDTVSNIFGGFTIFADKPFKVGDRIRVAGFDGTVVSVGVRSFRLKTLAGTLVAIPNSMITEGVVENVSLEPARKITLNLGLTYDTTPEQMESAMSILKLIAFTNDSVENDYIVSFNSFGDFSLGILFIYYIVKGEDILQTQTMMNIEILKQFNEAGLEFAFPTQTVYTKASVG